MGCTCVLSRFYSVLFLFCKQKTAYEMRISDWSSDVCSSDLGRLGDITAFEAECRQATTLDQLKSLLDAIVRQFGFRWFALVHNVDLKRTTRKALLITTYPARWRSEEHTSELQSLMRISYAVFCLKKKNKQY